MEWHRSLLDVVEKAKKNGLILYGAGFWGMMSLDIFRLFEINKIYFCDDDYEKQGTQMNGIKIMSLEQAVTKFQEAVYVVCIDETSLNSKTQIKNRQYMLARLHNYELYTKHSEIHMSYYTFLLDMDINIFNRTSAESRSGRIKTNQLKKLILFNNMSNSGAYYCEQLLDGHPEMVFLPYVESMERVYLKRLQLLEGKELLIEIMAQLYGYFKSQFNYLDIIGQHKFNGYCIDCNGEYEKRVYIDANVFLEYIILAFGESDNGKIKFSSYGHMLKVLFAAYSNAIGKKNIKDEYWIFYHMHLPAFDVSEMYNTLNEKEFNRIENLIIIRDPIQHLYSWIKRFVLQQKKVSVATGTFFEMILKSDLGLMLEKKEKFENVKAVRFEDLKYNNRSTLENLCRWLGIEWDEILTKTTLNGIEIYFPVTVEGKVEYITGNDTRTVNQRDYTGVMTKEDEKRFAIIFSKFRKAYNYSNKVFDFSDIDVHELLRQDFKYYSLISQLIEEAGDTVSIENSPRIQGRKVFSEYIENYRNDTEYYDFL